MRFFRNLALASAVAGLVLSSVSPAAAQEYRGHREYRRDRGGDVGTAIVAGILGAMVGAAVAGGNNGNGDERRYEQRQYAPPPPPYYTQQPRAENHLLRSHNSYTGQDECTSITFQSGDESWRNYESC